jgi:hypothetical protein
MKDNLDILYLHQIANCAKLRAITHQLDDSLQWIIVYEQKNDYGHVMMSLSDMPNLEKQHAVAQKDEQVNCASLPKLLNFCIENNAGRQLFLQDNARYNIHIQLFVQLGLMIDELLKDYFKTEASIKNFWREEPEFTVSIKETYDRFKIELSKCVNTTYVNSGLNEIFFMRKGQFGAFNDLLEHFGILNQKEYGC